MRYCLCGNAAIENGAECLRCRALRVLGLQAGASDKAIRSAYHVLVKVWHPDRLQQDPTLRSQAEEKLKQVTAAYRYLSSNRADEEQPAGQSESQASAPPSSKTPGATATDSKPERVRPIVPAWVSLVRTVVLSSLGVTVMYVVGFALVAWLMFRPINRFLSSEPLTGESYRQLKSDIHSGLWGAGSAVSGYFAQLWQGADARKNPPPAPIASQPVDARSETHASGKTSKLPYRIENIGETDTNKLYPYVTAGLSKEEVIAVQGQPTSSSENQLLYGNSELDFTNNKLVGWKIDPASPHIRIKLWPDSAVSPETEYFWIGSSKNEVLAVQGTPTLWSENTWGYGRSEVYFSNGKVVNWKNDPATVPLRAKQP